MSSPRSRLKHARASKSSSRAEFGRELRRRRAEAKMTLEDLAGRSGLSPNYIGSIEIGKRDPSLSTMEALAQALDAPLGELFGDVPKLGALGLEVAEMFDGAPERVRSGLLSVLRYTATLKQPAPPAVSARREGGAGRAE